MEKIQQPLKALLLMFTLFVISCKNEEGKTATQEKEANDTIVFPSAIGEDPVHYCYQYLTNGDTVEMELVVGPGDVVSGELLYQIAEKDRNKGTFKGIIYMDTILADYTFMSEGKQSVREVTFLRKDSSLTEGYAAMEEADGKMQFRAGVVPKYTGMKLMLTNCKN